MALEGVKTFVVPADDRSLKDVVKDLVKAGKIVDPRLLQAVQDYSRSAQNPETTFVLILGEGRTQEERTYEGIRKTVVENELLRPSKKQAILLAQHFTQGDLGAPTLVFHEPWFNLPREGNPDRERAFGIFICKNTEKGEVALLRTVKGKKHNFSASWAYAFVKPSQ